MEDNAPEGTTGDNVLLGGYNAPQQDAAPVVTEGQAPQVESAPVHNSDWLGTFDDDTKGYIENKAWKSPADMLQSYQNLEKMSGGNAEQLYRITGDMDDEARNNIYNVLGRPEAADKYSYEAQEGDHPEMVNGMKEIAHKYGLSNQQLTDIIPEFNEMAIGIASKQTEAINNQNHQAFEKLQGEWGQDFDAKTNFASRAANHFGITEDMQRAVVGSGHAADFTKALANIGSLMAEGQMVGMNPDASRSAMGVMTREEAQSKIDAKMNNDDFKKRYLSHDQNTRMAARAELEPLRKASVGNR
tara:strand:- start:128 stop:1030 length:903 start_codon:yes stop_codon:yes gene_type:complete